LLFELEVKVLLDPLKVASLMLDSISSTVDSCMFLRLACGFNFEVLCFTLFSRLPLSCCESCLYRINSWAGFGTGLKAAGTAYFLSKLDPVFKSYLQDSNFCNCVASCWATVVKSVILIGL